MTLSEERSTVLRQTIARRQSMTVVLENIHDPHNIGAVMRTCDSVGIQELYVIITDPRIDPDRYRPGKSSSSGIRKWLDFHVFDNVDSCFSVVKSRYRSIFGTHLGQASSMIYDMDLKDSCAFVFGNEHSGISKEALQFVDSNLTIPQVGLVQSLNISVACAVTLYEAFRQRHLAGFYDKTFDPGDLDHQQLMDKFLRRHKKRP